MDYRIYKLSADQRVSGPPEVMKCASDQEAVERAKQKLNGLALEVWQGARVVVCLEPQDK